MAITAEQQAKLDRLINLVTLRIDEYTEDIDGEAPEAPIGDIPSELGVSAKAILHLLPRFSLFSLSKKADAVVLVQPTAEERGTIVPLPDDYVRFISIRMAGWHYPVTSVIREDDDMIKKQAYEYLKTTNNSPFATLVPYTNASKKALEVFPKSDTLQDLFYAPYYKVYDLPGQFDDAVVWHATSNVLLTMRLTALADKALQKLDLAIKILNSEVA